MPPDRHGTVTHAYILTHSGRYKHDSPYPRHVPATYYQYRGRLTLMGMVLPARLPARAHFAASPLRALCMTTRFVPCAAAGSAPIVKRHMASRPHLPREPFLWQMARA